jgi:hypothetical protein
MLTVNACRSRLRSIRETAARLDTALVKLAAVEAEGDGPLTAVQRARLLLALDKLAVRLEQESDLLAEWIDPQWFSTAPEGPGRPVGL